MCTQTRDVKKQIYPSINAYLLRSALILLSLFTFNQNIFCQESLSPAATPTPTCPAAQNYTYTLTIGSYLPGTTDAGVHCDDCSTPVPFPFTVKIYDTPFTSALAGSNGELSFGVDYAGFGITCMPVDSATYTIGPMWVDQTTLPSHCPTCGVFTSVTGTAPNRTF
ncbi:MAG: hypothetical protein DMF24_06890, partial [Verrucomicrobia bacterium]